MEDRKGVSFVVMLQTLFIVLKLNGAGAIAAWSWWLVLTPLWVIALVTLFLIMLYAVTT